MKIAIVHDELMRRGGAEQVVKCFLKAFPEAPVYTLAYRPELTYPEFKNYKIYSSWYKSIATNERKLKKYFFPLGILAMRQLDVSIFDVILISSTYVAKYINPNKNALVINYCHQPFRLAWYPESYVEFVTAQGVKKLILNTVIQLLKKIDFHYAAKTTFFIANTHETKVKIEETYKAKNPITVIKPPVNCKKFFLSGTKQDYYLMVNRLEYYKKVDLVIDAFNTLGKKLIIVGKGSQEEDLKKRAKKNIIFQSSVTDTNLAKLYAECKGFIFPQLEDYGITPLEANAAGIPVIAFGEGGVLETMLPYKGDALQATALFFEEQSPESLIEAIQLYETLTFDKYFIRQHAEQFDEEIFIKKIRYFVINKYDKLTQ